MSNTDPKLFMLCNDNHWSVWRESSEPDLLGLVLQGWPSTKLPSVISRWENWKTSSIVTFDRGFHGTEDAYRAYDFLREHQIREYWLTSAKRSWQSPVALMTFNTEESRNFDSCRASFLLQGFDSCRQETTAQGPRQCVCPDGVWQAGCKCGAITPYVHPWDRR